MAYKTHIADDKLKYDPLEVKKYGVPLKTLRLMMTLYDSLGLEKCNDENMVDQLIFEISEQSTRKNRFDRDGDDVYNWCRYWFDSMIQLRELEPDNNTNNNEGE